jgi:choline dehydrogenase-like flavoprotein
VDDPCAVLDPPGQQVISDQDHRPMLPLPLSTRLVHRVRSARRRVVPASASTPAPPDPDPTVGHHLDAPDGTPLAGLTGPERRLRWAMVVGFLAFVPQAALYLPTVLNGPAASRGFAVSATAKDTLFCALFFLVAADPRRFRRAVLVIALGELVLVVQLAVVWAAGRTQTTFPPVTYHWRLQLWMLIDVVIVLLLSWLWWSAGRARSGASGEPPPDGRAANALAASPNDRRLGGLAVLVGIVNLLTVPAYLWYVWSGPPTARGYAISGSAGVALVVAALALARGDMLRLRPCISAVVIAQSVTAALLVMLFVLGRTVTTFPDWPPAPGGLSAPWRLALWLAASAAFAAGLGWLNHRSCRDQQESSYLAPLQFSTLAALAGVAVKRPLRQHDGQHIARIVDHYWAKLEAEGKDHLHLALWILWVAPLLTLRAPLALLDPCSRRRWLERRLILGIASRQMLSPARNLMEPTIRFAMQMAYLGYYSQPEHQRQIGFIPFPERPGARRLIEMDRPNPRPLRTLPPREIDGESIEADVVIVGTGAAGGMIAHELLRRGRGVLMLERGKHVDPRDFPAGDELYSFRELYGDGALQLSRDLRFQVAQGMCVGGSTVVNNGVCFDLPDETLQRWNEQPLAAGICAEHLRKSFREVRQLMDVNNQLGVLLNPGGSLMLEGAHRLRLDSPPNRVGAVDANIRDCFGCGYCNVGCPYGRKLSMLEWLLPAAQDRFGQQRLRILSECRADRIRTRGGRATSVACLLRDGRRLEVQARTVVVAAGAISSSRLLQQSRLGGAAVGDGLCANIGSFLTADFEEPIRSFAGQQMGHFFEPMHEQGYLIESWFNPVLFQTLVMPGWFDDHEYNMRRYAHLTCGGVIVGSTPGRSRVLRRTDWMSGSHFSFDVSQDDLKRVISGLVKAGELLFAGGAKRVVPATFRYLQFCNRHQLGELEDFVKDDSDIYLSTAHPQGGNAMSERSDRGVVDERFRVRGVEGLYVCDASVFPTAAGVNPQLTVMALAHYAARHHIE